MAARHRPKPVTVKYADGRVEIKRASRFVKPKYWQSQRWRNLRARALERDGHRCAWCRGEEKLEVHHKTYERYGHERLEDLVTLCQRCHSKEHHWRRARSWSPFA